jgi:hypothetical protein
MSKSDKPRKAYRPKPVHTNALERAIESARKLDPHSVQRVINDCARAFDALKRQDDPDASMRTLATALNIGEQLAALGIASDRESIQAMASALDQIAELHERLDAGQGCTMRSEQIKAIEEGLVRHYIQLRHCSRREYDTALETANRVCYQARIGNHSPRARVLRYAQVLG